MNIINELNSLKQTMPDLQIKKISFLFKKIYIINIQSISSSKDTNDFILKYFSNISILNKLLFLKDINNYIPSISFIVIKEKELLEYLFNGFTILIYKNKIYAFETKQELNRSITEPISEPTIKGPKDSFNENYNANIGLIRKRIKDKNLYIKELTLGQISKTKIAIIYMNNLIDNSLLNDVINKINNIKTDKILDTYYIKELIKNENKTIIPTIKSSEKPDTIVKCLTEGKICILSENSSDVLIIPTFFIDFFYNSEDNYQKKAYFYFIRIIRIFAFFITIFAPSIYLSLITYDQAILPTNLLLNFQLQRLNVPFPAIIEAFLLMFTFELLYEADSLTPSSKGTSLSILGALVLGDAAVSAGIVSPIMVIVVAITAISGVLFSYKDLETSIRVYRYSLMILSCFFGIIGNIFGLLFILTKICSIKSFNKPFIISFDTFKTKKQLIKNALLPQNTDKTN